MRSSENGEYELLKHNLKINKCYRIGMQRKTLTTTLVFITRISKQQEKKQRKNIRASA